MQRMYFAYAMLGIALIISCKKEKKTEPEPTPKTKAEILTEGKWQISGTQITWYDTSGQVHNEEIFNNIRECEKDDFRVFSEDGKITFDEGEKKCIIDKPQTSTGAWKLEKEDSELMIKEHETDDQWSSFEVLEISDTLLKYKYVYTTGENITTTLSYKNIK